MKPLAVAFSCLAFALVLNAQQKPQFQLTPPPNLLEFPPQPVSPSIMGAIQGLDLRGNLPKRAQIPPNSLNLTFKANQTGVCSVPLLDAHADANDPGIAFRPESNAVPIPQARVPAPACRK